MLKLFKENNATFLTVSLSVAHNRKSSPMILYFISYFNSIPELRTKFPKVPTALYLILSSGSFKRLIRGGMLAFNLKYKRSL